MTEQKNTERRTKILATEAMETEWESDVSRKTRRGRGNYGDWPSIHL